MPALPHQKKKKKEKEDDPPLGQMIVHNNVENENFYFAAQAHEAFH